MTFTIVQFLSNRNNTGQPLRGYSGAEEDKAYLMGKKICIEPDFKGPLGQKSIGFSTEQGMHD